MKPFEVKHEDYEKYSDDIYYIGANLVLRMNVQLASKGEDGRRYFYHQEYCYESNKYIDTNKAITVRRKLNYYLSIENIKYVDGFKESIMIRNQDMFNLRRNFELASNWFFNNELFAVDKNNKLVMLGSPDPIIIRGFAQGKTITLEPIVIHYENASYEGIRIYLDSTSNYIDVNIDKFMGLLYILSCINLYESAQLLLNYHTRPPMGENLVVFEGGEYSNDDGKIEGVKGRTIKAQTQNKSFFDKMKDM